MSNLTKNSNSSLSTLSEAYSSLSESERKALYSKIANNEVELAYLREKAMLKAQIAENDTTQHIHASKELSQQRDDFYISNEFETAGGKMKVTTSRRNSSNITIVAVVIGIIALLVIAGQ